MNKVYNTGSRGELIRLGAGLPEIDFGNLDQDTIVKWVVVPGATVAALVLLTRLVKRRKRRR